MIAVDDSQAESLGRSITLPVMRATLTAGTRIKRGIMNRLEYEVKNLSSTWLDNIRLKVDVAGYSHTSEECSINGGETIVVPVIVGGYDDLEDLVDLATTLKYPRMPTRRSRSFAHLMLKWWTVPSFFRF